MKFVFNSFKKYRQLGMLMGVLLPFFSPCYAQIVLRFKPHISEQASSLGDLLLIENDQQQWSKQPLLSHPKAGEIIQRDKLIAWMTHQFGHFDWQWKGSLQKTVEKQDATSQQALITYAQTSLLQQLKPSYTRVEVTPLNQQKLTKKITPPFKTQITVQFPVPKRVCVWVVHQNRRLPIWFSVKAWQPVLLAKKPLAAASPLNETQFILKERNIAGLRSQPVSHLGKRIRLKKSLPAQQILLKDNLESIPEIIQGETVQITVRQGSIQLITEAIAMKEGYLGQILPFKNANNQQTFLARITGIQKAEIRP